MPNSSELFGKVILMKKLQDFAHEMGVTDRMIQKHLRTHAAELEGHYERKGPNGTWLDDEAQEIIRSKMRQTPVAIFEEDPRVKRQQAEIEDLREQLKKKDNVLYGLIEKNEAMELQLQDLQLLTAGKEEAEKKVADLELALTTLQDVASEAEKKAIEAEEQAASIRKEKLNVELKLEEVKEYLEEAKEEAEKHKHTADSWASDANRAKEEVRELTSEFSRLKEEHEKLEQMTTWQFSRLKKAQKAAIKKQAKEEKKKNRKK